jgi:hypothetical protein
MRQLIGIAGLVIAFLALMLQVVSFRRDGKR